MPVAPTTAAAAPVVPPAQTAPPQMATPDTVGYGMAAFARGDGVVLGDLIPVGAVNLEAAQVVGRRAVGSMGDCRRPGTTLSVRIQISFALGQIRIAHGDPNLPGDPQASQCVANAYRAAAPSPWSEIGTSGIFTFRADLAAR
jgi:hypothetical protein